MITTNFLLTLKNQIKPDDWIWLIAALRQDAIIWKGLEENQLFERALNELGSEAENWSPAALALLILNLPASTGSLKEIPLQPLPAALHKSAERAIKEWQHKPSSELVSLEQAGLIALALRERFRGAGSWERIFNPLGDTLQTLRPVLACLYGIAPDAIELLHELVDSRPTPTRLAQALHSILCNPIPPDKQIEVIQNVIQDLPIPLKQSGLAYLSGQRPAMASKLAQRFINQRKPSSKIKQNVINTHLATLMYFLEEAEAHRLAGQSNQTVTLLNETSKANRRLQADTTAKLAQALKLTGDLKGSLESWKQAVQLAPDSDLYSAELIISLLDFSRENDALTFFSSLQNEDSNPPHPSLMLAAAMLYQRLGQMDEARQFGRKSLEYLKSNPKLANLDTQGFYIPMLKTLTDLGLTLEAEQVVLLGLKAFPNDPDLLAELIKIQLIDPRLTPSIPEAYTALTFQSQNDELRRMLILSLEKCGEWDLALKERQLLMQEKTAAKVHPTQADWREMANCALRANQPQEAKQACQKTLEIDPEDGLAYALLGEANLTLGDEKAALEDFRQATQLAPQESAPWLVLSQTYQRQGQSDKALETLRAASQAAPNSVEIFLALGEAYLARESPTQALTSFRRAAALIASKEQGSSAKSEGSVQPVNTMAMANRIAYLLGKTLRQLGHLDEAKQVLGQVYQIDPQEFKKNPELTYVYAKTLVDLGEVVEALVPLKLVVESEPKDPEPYFDFARALLRIALNEDQSQGIDRESYAEQAIPLLGRYLVMTSEEEPALNSSLSRSRAEAQTLLAEAYAISGDPQKAMDWYRLALDSPLANDPEWRIRLTIGVGKAALELGQLDTAIASLQEAIQIDNQSSEAYRLLSDATLSAGLLGDSAQAARAALTTQPMDISNLVWFFHQSMRLSAQPGGAVLNIKAESLQALQRAVELEPYRGDLLVELGQTLLQEGDRKAALETFNKLSMLVKQMEDKPDSSASKLNSGDLFLAFQSLESLGDYSKAIELLEKAISLAQVETQPPFLIASLFAELSKSYLRINQTSSAIQALDKALFLEPGNIDIHLKKAEILLESLKTEEALSSLEEALRLIPDDPRLLLKLALVKRMTGDVVAAFSYAEQAFQISQGNEIELASRCAAAELSIGMLLPEKTKTYLRVSNFSENEDALPQAKTLRYAFNCLKLEELLEESDFNEIISTFEKIKGFSQAEPRTSSLEARVLIRQGNWQESFTRFDTAIQSSKELQVASASNLFEAIAAWRELGLGAIELANWSFALEAFNQLINIAPDEPYGHLQIARTLVLRAENQRLCQKLDAVHYSPGEAVLSEEAYRNFETAIENTRKTFSRLKQEKTVIFNAMINHWHARGKAVFNPSPQTAATLEATTEGPDDIAALISTYGSIGDISSATSIAKAYPHHPLVLMHLGLVLSDSNPRQALNAANTARENISSLDWCRFYDKPLLLALLARLNYKNGARADDRILAQKSIQSALEFWPDEPRWHALAAEIAMKAPEPDIESAIAHLQKAIQVEPGYAQHFLSLGLIYLDKSDLSNAIEILEQASQVAPESSDIWINLARAYRLSGNLDQAADSTERAIETAADPIPALMLSGELAILRNNPRDALARAQSILQINPNHPSGLYLLARALSVLNRPVEALSAIDRAIPLSDDQLPLLLERARLIQATRGKEAGLETLQELSRRRPDEPLIQAQLAHALIETGQNDLAIQTAIQALNNDHGSLPTVEQASLHHLIGHDLIQLGQLDQAISHLSEAIRLSPESLESYLELGRVYQQRRQYNLALTTYQQAIHIFPRDHRPYFQAGIALKENKQYVESESYLRRAAELAPNDVSIHRLLGAVVALNLVHSHQQATANS